jgi:hypothetical protein
MNNKVLFVFSGFPPPCSPKLGVLVGKTVSVSLSNNMEVNTDVHEAASRDAASHGGPKGLIIMERGFPGGTGRSG